MARAAFAELFGAKPDEVAFLFTTADGEPSSPTASTSTRRQHRCGRAPLYRDLPPLQAAPRGKGHRAPYRSRDGGPCEDGRFRGAHRRKDPARVRAWVSNRNGYRHDLRALTGLAHAKGTLVYADAVQALGTFPTNLTELGVDFACSAVHKWLFAGFGVAPFFIARSTSIAFGPIATATARSRRRSRPTAGPGTWEQGVSPSSISDS